MRTIAVIGGDERAARLATFCKNQGFSVFTLGLRENDERICPIEEADGLFFPYPFSVMNTGIPNQRGLNIDPSEILARAKDGVRIMAGDGLTPYVAAVRALGKEIHIRYYAEDAVFLQANAEISAEGAVCYAMRQMCRTVLGTTCLVTGYGLFARAIALKWKALGGYVIVAARSPAARQKAREDGMGAIGFDELTRAAGGVRLLMNTVPSQVIREETLKALPKGALLLELASAPYGFDMKKAGDLGLCGALLPGIPGKYAPETAAEALFMAAPWAREGEEQ